MTTTAARLGDAATAMQTVQIGGSTAAAVLPFVTKAAWAVPAIGAAVAGVTAALALIFGRKGPRQKVATTEIVNELEPLLKQNLEAFFAGPRTQASKEAALKNFDDAWAYLTSAQACGNPDMGNPGKACINDRKAGACTWRDASGQCWNWFTGYRDPIARAEVSSDPAANLISSVWPTAPAGALDYAIPAALIVAALVI